MILKSIIVGVFFFAAVHIEMISLRQKGGRNSIRSHLSLLFLKHHESFAE